MALISSESMTLIVNGTLQSEFFTMFWPMRFTYSSTTGSVINFVLFSISSAYCLPILISLSVEYQLPMPRLPISRLPTAATSSSLPGFTFTIWLPISTILSGFTATAVASQSPPTGVVPGAGPVESLASLSFLSFFLSFLSSAAGAAGHGGSCALLADVSAPAVVPVPALGCFAGAGESPPTGVVPGAGCAAGGVCAAGCAAEVDCEPLPACDEVCAVGVLACGSLADGVDCAPSAVATASANPARTAVLTPVR